MSNEDIVYFLFLSIILSCLLHVYFLYIHITHGDGFLWCFSIYVFADK